MSYTLIKLSENEILFSKDSKVKKSRNKAFCKDLKDIDNESFNSIAYNIEPKIFMLRCYLCVSTKEFNID